MCDFASLARGSLKTHTGEALSSFPRDRFAQARLATKPLHSPVVAPQTWNDDDSLLLGFGLFGACTRGDPAVRSQAHYAPPSYTCQ